MPHLSNVYYLVDPSSDTIRMSTTTVRAKGRHLLRDPRAALYVARASFLKLAVARNRRHWSSPSGRETRRSTKIFEVHHGLGAVTERPGFDDEMIANHRMVVRLHVERIYGLIIDREPRAVKEERPL